MSIAITIRRGKYTQIGEYTRINGYSQLVYRRQEGQEMREESMTARSVYQ